MKNFILIAALGATALGGANATIAIAQTPPSVPAPGIAPPPPPRPSSPGALLRADADRDGIVTRAEAITEADRRFAALDADRDGKVSKDERRAERERHRAERIANAAPPLPGARPERDGPGKHHRGDRMKDRPETLTEMRDRATKMFDRVDTNHDGRVDQQERDAMELLIRARRAGHEGHRSGPRGDAPPPASASPPASAE